MKNNILKMVFLLTIGTSITMVAQTAKIGIKAGYNYANFDGNAPATFSKEAISSYHVGLVAKAGLVKGIGAQAEILYSTQGASYKNALTEFKNELGYLSIPVTLNIGLSKSLELNLGPQASFLVSKKDEFKVNDYNSFDFSAVGGLTWNVTNNFYLQGRYLLGLTEVSKDADITNKVIQVSAGFYF